MPSQVTTPFGSSWESDPFDQADQNNAMAAIALAKLRSGDYQANLEHGDRLAGMQNQLAQYGTFGQQSAAAAALARLRGDTELSNTKQVGANELANTNAANAPAMIRAQLEKQSWDLNHALDGRVNSAMGGYLDQLGLPGQSAATGGAPSAVGATGASGATPGATGLSGVDPLRGLAILAAMKGGQPLPNFAMQDAQTAELKAETEDRARQRAAAMNPGPHVASGDPTLDSAYQAALSTGNPVQAEASFKAAQQGKAQKLADADSDALANDASAFSEKDNDVFGFDPGDSDATRIKGEYARVVSELRAAGHPSPEAAAANIILKNTKHSLNSGHVDHLRTDLGLRAY